MKWIWERIRRCLQRSVGFDESWTNHRGPRVLVEIPGKSHEGIRLYDCVRIQKKNVFRIAVPNSLIGCRTVTDINGVYVQPDPWEFTIEHGGAVIGRAIVDNNDLTRLFLHDAL